MTVPADPIQGRPWRILALVLVGLLVTVAVASMAALILTRSVGDVADRALRSDIALEDEAEDVLISVLAVRQYQRTLTYAGPTRSALADFDRAYRELLTELDELAAVDVDPAVTRTDELVALATAYHAAFRPSVELFLSDPDAFDAASDQGLVDLAALQDRAEALDRLGEQRSTAALGNVESATATATVAMLLILVGVIAAGLALSFVAWRVLRELRGLATAQQETADQLRDALRARNDLIADASHELRTPLTVLRGNAEVGLAMGPSDCAHEPILREIVAESARMTRLVEDLLFLARSDAGAAPLEPTDIDLEPWLADLGARAEVLCRERGVAFEPRLTVTGRARLDPERMAQAVLILVDNAARFSPTNAPVEVTATVEGDRLVLVTTDHGPGIPADLVPYVFDRFRRGDPARGRRSTGAGLGLAIAQAIVEGHAGSIEAGERPGGGARMVIRIPISGPAVAGAPAA
jgi:signal transduction histidine kinase